MEGSSSRAEQNRTEQRMYTHREREKEREGKKERKRIRCQDGAQHRNALQGSALELKGFNDSRAFHSIERLPQVNLRD